MPRNLTPEDRWETDFQVPIPGEPRNIGPLETLFQRLLNRTERLKNRLGAILGLPWDATPPDTLAGLAGRVSTLETNQYDHQNRFVVQSFLTDFFNFPANYVHRIAVIPVSIPSGKAIYLRRVRWALSAFLRPRVRATNQNTWTGSTNFGDASMNVLLGNSSTTFVSLEIVNNTSDGLASLISDGIWAEFEIR